MNGHKLILRAVLVAMLGAAVIWLGLHRALLQPATIASALRRCGGWAPLVFVLMYAVGAIMFAPGLVLTMAGGVVFGPVWGCLWNLAGATLGATAAFLIARYLASDWVAARSGERLGRLMRGVDEEGWRFVAFVRLVPLFPFNLVNYAFGLTGIRPGEYVIASFVCMAPGVIAYTYLGYAGREAAAGQAGAIGKALASLALLAAVAFLPRLVRRMKGRRSIDAATLHRRLESGADLVLIDVRTPAEFDGPLGHIAGARNIPLPQLAAKLRELGGLEHQPLITI